MMFSVSASLDLDCLGFVSILYYIHDVTVLAMRSSGESLLSKAITSTSSKFTVSSVQDVSTGGGSAYKGTSWDNKGASHQGGILKTISITSSIGGPTSSHVSIGGGVKQTANKPLSVSMPGN